MKKIAVLGTGNIAQTVAVDLKSNGHEVRLFAPDYLISRIQKIVDTHEIECVGVFEAKEKIDVVTSDIDKAVKGADSVCSRQSPRRICENSEGTYHCTAESDYVQWLHGFPDLQKCMGRGCVLPHFCRIYYPTL